MELAIMHIDNRVESLEEARNCLDLMCNNHASGTNQGAIDNRIEQAMDLVKSHLMNAVRSEVEELKEKIIKLEETINQQQIELTTSSSNFNREVGKLQAENQFLRNHVGSDVINQLSNLEFYDPVNQATQQQQQNQVQSIQDSQSIQVSTTKQTAPSTQSQQSHQ
jgi:chromosomal replication initiation ATPase DnaA